MQNGSVLRNHLHVSSGKVPEIYNQANFFLFVYYCKWGWWCSSDLYHCSCATPFISFHLQWWLIKFNELVKEKVETECKHSELRESFWKKEICTILFGTSQYRAQHCTEFNSTFLYRKMGKSTFLLSDK